MDTIAYEYAKIQLSDFLRLFTNSDDIDKDRYLKSNAAKNLKFLEWLKKDFDIIPKSESTLGILREYLKENLEVSIECDEETSKISVSLILEGKEISSDFDYTRDV